MAAGFMPFPRGISRHEKNVENPQHAPAFRAALRWYFQALRLGQVCNRDLQLHLSALMSLN
jgi:hypothetical protein